MPADCSLLLESGRRFPPVYYNEIVTRGEIVDHSQFFGRKWLAISSLFSSYIGQYTTVWGIDSNLVGDFAQFRVHLGELFRPLRLGRQIHWLSSRAFRFLFASDRVQENHGGGALFPLIQSCTVRSLGPDTTKLSWSV